MSIEAGHVLWMKIRLPYFGTFEKVHPYHHETHVIRDDHIAFLSKEEILEINK